MSQEIDAYIDAKRRLDEVNDRLAKFRSIILAVAEALKDAKSVRVGPGVIAHDTFVPKGISTTYADDWPSFDALTALIKEIKLAEQEVNQAYERIPESSRKFIR